MAGSGNINGPSTEVSVYRPPDAFVKTPVAHPAACDLKESGDLAAISVPGIAMLVITFAVVPGAGLRNS